MGADAGRGLDDRTLRVWLDDLDAIVWEADPTTWRFTYVNRSAERILGYPPDEWIRDPGFWVRTLHPEDRGRAIVACQEATAAGRDHDLEYRVIAADGRAIWIRDVVRIGRDSAGQVRDLHGLMIDITGLKQLEERVDARGRDVARLEGITLAAREMAHRLNNSLSIAIGSLDLLSEHPAMPPEAIELICGAIAALDVAATDIGRFQQLSRVETCPTPFGPARDLGPAAGTPNDPARAGEDAVPEGSQ